MTLTEQIDRTSEVPYKTLKACGLVLDRDTVAICAVFQISYIKGRILKALSFGLPCTSEELLFCMGRDDQDPARVDHRSLSYHLRGLRDHPAGFRIQTLTNGDLMIWDAITLHAIRSAMEASNPP